jgi:hypothetical protein
MKIRQALLNPIALSVLLALAGAPAGAQDAATSAATTSGTSATSEGLSEMLVPIEGSVSGSETVRFSGQALIKSRLVKDPDFGNNAVLLSFDFSSVSGAGRGKTTYVIPTKDLVKRRLAVSHQVDLTFPFMRTGSTDMFSARSGVAFFALDINVSNGKILNATGRIESPSF